MDNYAEKLRSQGYSVLVKKEDIQKWKPMMLRSNDIINNYDGKGLTDM